MIDLNQLELRRLRQTATIGSVRSSLVFRKPFESELAQVPSVNMSRFRSVLDDLLKINAGSLDTATDSTLACELHQSLSVLNRRTLTDPLMWQWLSLEVFPDYVASRWFGGFKVDQLSERDSEHKYLVADSAVKRFLGTATLVGVSRNALARLYWGAEAAWSQASGSDRYADVDLVFSSSDLFVGVFERVLGLRSDAALELIRKIRNLDEEARRRIVLNFNLVLSTTCIEAMDISDIEQLVNDLVSLESGDVMT